MTDRLELAERVEKATGPDRELDDDIFAAMGHCKHSPKVEMREINGELDLITTCEKCGSAKISYPLHRYTASLDAAMTLVPEGWAATVVRFKDGSGKAIIWQGSWLETHRATDGIMAATPALALTAAALRASHSQN